MTDTLVTPVPVAASPNAPRAVAPAIEAVEPIDATCRAHGSVTAERRVCFRRS